MNTRFWHGHCVKIGIALAATSGYLFSQKAIAQIVPDRTLGAESSVVTPNVDIKGFRSDRIDAGAIRGANLFHSFQEFNIREGRGAYFSNPTGIENIFSRVTGTNASNILGKLGVLGNANLFLLNPNGVIFGPNASLDIAGSFSASTGNSFNFGDDKFSATNPTGAPLISVKVPLGVQFNQNQPSAIANFGNLSMGTGQNLNLMGGTVVSTGQLSAPSGQVAVASVPGGSVVNLSSSAQFINIETPSPVTSVGSFSLAELLTSVDERERPGLTVNSNGQSELTSSGLPVVDGDLVVRNVTAKTATLTANNNLTLVESQLSTTGDLNLLARDTVRVRDSVANPFVAQAGGNLLVQGRQGVNIFALNNSSSGLFSGGDLVLRSLNTVGGDAHYWAGGNFRIEKLDGSLGGLFSPYDPIIRASGDVSFASYTGGSLHILAGGSVTIPGTVTIRGADGTNGLVQRVFLSDDDPNGDRSFVDIDGANFPTLDIRAGTTAFGIPGLTPNPIPGIVNPSFGSVPTSANIQIGSIDNRATNGQVFLTNRYVQNDRLQGSITITDGIPAPDAPALGSTSIAAYGSDVTIDAKNDVTIARGIISGTTGGTAGDVKVLSGGVINTTGGSIISRSDNLAGDVTLQASGDIGSGNIEAENNSDQNFSTIKLESSQGSVFLNGVKLSTDNNGTGFAGDIFISTGNNVNNNVEIAGSQINTDGYFGTITIQAGGKVFITNSIVTAQIEGNLPTPAEGIQRQAGNIQINSQNGSVSVIGSSQVRSSSKVGGEGNAGSVTIKAGDTVTIAGRASDNLATVGTDVTGGGVGNGGLLTIEARSVDIKDGAIVAASILFGKGRNGEPAQAGDVNITATDKVSVNNSVVFSEIGSGSVGNGGKINITAPTVTLDNGASLITNVRGGQDRESGRGRGGEIEIATQSLSLKGGSLLGTSTSGQSSAGQGGAGNVTIKGYNTEASNTVSVDGQGSNAFSSLFKSLNPNANANINQIIPSVILSTVEQSAQGVNNGGNIDIKTGSLSVTEGARLSASTFAQGNAGNVIINANDTVTFDNGIAFVTVEPSGKGQGGDIRISIPTGSLFVGNGGQLQALTNGEGNAGNVIINAGNTVTFDNGIAFATVGKSGRGQGGDIRISIPTGSLFVGNGGQLQAQTNGQGKAGNVIINVGNTVNISGSNSINRLPSALFTSTSPESTGAGGDITIGNITKPNLFRISDGAVLFASTSNNDKAGNITINANRFEAINGGQLIARTTSNGAAGTINVNADKRVTVSGLRKLGGANDTNIFTNPDTNRLVANPGTNSEVFSGFYVNSRSSTSRAGDIVVDSPIVFLDNHGRLIADSASSNGGNITLQNGHLLLLRRNSLISTTAGTEEQPGSGGNIKVDYPKGFIIAGFGRNNDIVANAFNGSGGIITIDALGVVNIEALKREDLIRRLQPKPDPLDPRRLQTSDITAISQQDPNLSGTVNLNAPNVDPTRGTIQLPEDLGDSSKLIAQSCPVGIQGAANRFVVTGRGGLAPNPGSALSTDTFLGNAANAGSGENATASTSVAPQEAQGVEIGSRGEIILTARPSTLTPHSPWQRLRGCYEK
jgi:filamentous hemagglutinin family protein